MKKLTYSRKDEIGKISKLIKFYLPNATEEICWVIQFKNPKLDAWDEPDIHWKEPLGVVNLELATSFRDILKEAVSVASILTKTKYAQF